MIHDALEWWRSKLQGRQRLFNQMGWPLQGGIRGPLDEIFSESPRVQLNFPRRVSK